jgi:hypothetical protein
MVSLRRRERGDIIGLVEGRVSKMPMVLDRGDFDVQLGRAVRVLDEMMFNPRSVILSNAGSGLVDVTGLCIDEVCTVYYSADAAQDILGGLDLGVGVLPLLSGVSVPVGGLEGVVDYLILKNVINMIQRKMMNVNDYVLLPVGGDGRQYLEVKNPGGLLWVEFLPYVDGGGDWWYLYENEFQFVVELCFLYVCMANFEVQMSASGLGVGKEAVGLYNIYERRVGELVKGFGEGSVITYLG